MSDCASDDQLVAEVLGGNREAFAELVHRYKNKVYGLLRGMGADPMDAQVLERQLVCRDQGEGVKRTMSYALQDREQQQRTFTFGEKTDILKENELYCYQIAFYLLQNEAGAQLAAERTLLALYPRGDFFTLPETERRAAVKAEAIRQSLQVKLQR